MAIDWTQLARDVGSLDDATGTEHGGDAYARAALERLLDIEGAVALILDGGRGTELAMNVLRYVRSERAVHLAYDAYRTSTGTRAATAVWLMKHIAHPCSVPWIAGFLRDENVAGWAVALLDQLVWCERVEIEEVEPLLVQAEQHANERVREHAASIRSFIAKRP